MLVAIQRWARTTTVGRIENGDPRCIAPVAAARIHLTTESAYRRAASCRATPGAVATSLGLGPLSVDGRKAARLKAGRRCPFLILSGCFRPACLSSTFVCGKGGQYGRPPAEHGVLRVLERPDRVLSSMRDKVAADLRSVPPRRLGRCAALLSYPMRTESPPEKPHFLSGAEKKAPSAATQDSVRHDPVIPASRTPATPIRVVREEYPHSVRRQEE